MNNSNICDLEEVKNKPQLVLLYDTETTRNIFSEIPRVEDKDLYDSKLVYLFKDYRLTQISWLLFNSQTYTILSSGNYDVQETYDKEMKQTLQRDEHEYYMKWKLRHKTPDYKVTLASLRTCLEAFVTDLKKASVVSSYYINFDIPVIVAEFRRLDLSPYVDLIQHKKKLCMMRASVEAINNVSDKRITRTSLQNIYTRLFHKDLVNHHDSFYDCLNTLEVYKTLPHIDPPIIERVKPELVSYDGLQMICDCGSKITWKNKSSHFKTLKHIKYIDENDIEQSEIDAEFEEYKNQHFISQIHKLMYAPEFIDKSEMNILVNSKSYGALCLMVSEVANLADFNHFFKDHEAIIKHITQYEKDFCKIAKTTAVTDAEIYKPNCDLFYKLLPDGKDGEQAYREYSYRDEFNRLCKVYPEIYEKIKLMPTKNVDTTKLVESTTSISEFKQIVENTIVDKIELALGSNPELAFDSTPELAFDSIPELRNPEITPDQNPEPTPELKPKSRLDIAIDNFINSNLPDKNLREHISAPAIRGRVREIGTIELLKKQGYIIEDLQQPVSEYINVKGRSVKLYGKVDGILYDPQTNLPIAVIDVKNRIKFKSIGSYDHIQLCCYAVLTGLKAILIEDYTENIKLRQRQHRNILYQNENRTLLIKVYSVEECKYYWDKLIFSEKLAINIDKIVSLTSNPYSVEAMIFARKHLMSIPRNNLPVPENIKVQGSSNLNPNLGPYL